MKIKVKVYESTTDAYNDTQCNEDIRNGDGTILVIPSEQVVGMAWTWPYAITTHWGELHKLNAHGEASGLAADSKVTKHQIALACAVAASHGFEIEPRWLEFAEAE